MPANVARDATLEGDNFFYIKINKDSLILTPLGVELALTGQEPQNVIGTTL